MVDTIVASFPVPMGWGTRVRAPFSGKRLKGNCKIPSFYALFLTKCIFVSTDAAHDWISLLGDLGSYALSTSTSLGTEQLSCLHRLHAWVQRVVARTHTESTLSEMESEIPRILTALELNFPSFILTISLHQLLHTVR